MSDSTKPKSARKPVRGKAIALFLATGVLCAIGLAIWIATSLSGTSESAKSFPAAPAAPAVSAAVAGGEFAFDHGKPGQPLGEDEHAYWSNVAIYRAGPNRPRSIVVVTRGKQPTAHSPEHSDGLLAREMVRQGFMLSARENLGALVRDVPIGDPAVSGEPDATLQVGSQFIRPLRPGMGGGKITIVDTSKGARRVVWSRDFDCRMASGPSYGLLASQVDYFSDEEFPKVLEGLGLKRATPAAKPIVDDALPAGVEERLVTMVDTEQFAAIRALHEAIRTGGETSGSLIGLGRAYANLGILSETQWTADHFAFMARSLLYAERGFRIAKTSASARRGIAYANILAGVPGVGEHEFEEADKLDGGKAAPPWALAARAYGHSDAGALASLAAERPADPLPLFFRFILLSRSSGLQVEKQDRLCRSEIVGAGRALAAILPDCYRVLDGVTDTRGVGNSHTATALALETFSAGTPVRLKAVPDLPKAVAEAIATEKGDEVDLREGLVAAAADDTSDLSWGVLAKQLREIRLAQVVRRLNFLAYLLGVPTRDEAIALAPIVRDHPNHALVETYLEPDRSVKIRTMLESLDLADIELKDDALLRRIYQTDRPLSDRVYDLASGHVSHGLVPEYELNLRRMAVPNQYNTARDVLILNPDSPLARSAMIRLRWDESGPKAAGWARDHGGDTTVIAELGFHALKAGKLDEARDRFETAMKQSPDRWIYDGLVATYRQKNDIDGWLKAAEAFLKHEDLSLDHAIITQDIAKYLMDQKDLVKARPWAELAAQSGAGWAMELARQCAEEMHDWGAAERWVAATSERYANSWLLWYYWCKRTGHGDSHAAVALVEAQVEEGRIPANPAEATAIALALLTEGRIDSARKFTEAQFRSTQDTSLGVTLAIIQDRQDDRAGRNATIKAVSTNPKPTGPKSAKLVGLVGDWLVKGDKTPLNLAPIEAILNDIPDARRAPSEVVLALFLDRHGKSDLATTYFKRANVKDTQPIILGVARDALRARKIDPEATP